ncbi:MAG: hypothetical protein H8E32_01345 [Nitrospinae bacterium]|nr:hypothetical protein [Nitrospinota bacterium]
MDEVKAWWSSAKFSGKFNDKDIAMIDSLIAEVNLMQTQKNCSVCDFWEPCDGRVFGVCDKDRYCTPCNKRIPEEK